VDDLQVRCGFMQATGDGVSVNKMGFTARWSPYTTRKTNSSLPDSRHLKLTLSQLKKRFGRILSIFFPTFQSRTSLLLYYHKKSCSRQTGVVASMGLLIVRAF